MGVHRNLAEAKQVGILRNDRPMGLAEGRFDRVHKFIPSHDLEVNTSMDSIFSVPENFKRGVF